MLTSVTSTRSLSQKIGSRLRGREDKAKGDRISSSLECQLTGQRGTYRVCFPTLSSVQQHPVVNSVLDLASVLERLGEEFTKEIVIGSLLKPELSDVVEVDGKLLW
jgi:hypothetical protein